ncbi:acyl-coenzyme A thioesterase 2, chloroplastic isoform X1 [Vicia villosa]|uniref:acyl-coenzyme A thioesterase 2, chloroplastic isoform X1 n=1 Tax=Vicia villosa TaxID=3911 RepID=UPI00273BC343|nr:acyl-coenzyme A thioesterase 2, chloroplastic isoform X1 [Vicia villosa]
MDLNSSPSNTPTYAISVNGTIPVSSTFAVSTTPFETPLPSNSSGDRKHIALWPGMYHSPVTTALWEARTKTFERLLDPPRDAPPQSELVTRTPSQSRTGILYNFSSDFVLREQYRDPWNDVRIGKLLEDLDALAGTISVKHCSDEDSTTRPLILVTASVDKIVLKKPITVNIDLTIVGSVIWVGHSSMEIQLEVTQSKQGDDDSDSIVLTANFIFVARDSKTGKAAPVNRLSPETAREKLLFEQAEARNNLKKRKRGGEKKDLENGEEKKLKDLLAEGRIFCDMPALADRDSILLRDTSLENSLLCQPQQRNIHGRIFGGFLMNRAFELAFSTAYAFAGLVPYFLEVDHVDFLRPVSTFLHSYESDSILYAQLAQFFKLTIAQVDVGDFLRLKSCVLYTELHDPDQPLINVEVVAHVTRPELRSSEVSNTFHFSFTVRPEAKAMKNGFKLRNVVPATEEEARRILERIDADNLNEFFRT